MDLSRRHFLDHSLLAAVPGAAGGRAALRIVCVGAHPDDPESGCGGTLARYAASGHAVTVIYVTRGERGIAGKSREEAGRIRTAEAQAACKILGARAVFAGQVNGAIELTEERNKAFTALLLAEQPDVVLAHWPIDTHLDHQVSSTLAFQALRAAPRKFQLYFFEVNAGSQTQGFHPTDYVDITGVREKKKAALFAHRSQDGEEIYRRHHQAMEEFRGREAGVAAAEAFVRLGRENTIVRLTGL